MAENDHAKNMLTPEENNHTISDIKVSDEKSPDRKVFENTMILLCSYHHSATSGKEAMDMSLQILAYLDETTNLWISDTYFSDLVKWKLSQFRREVSKRKSIILAKEHKKHFLQKICFYHEKWNMIHYCYGTTVKGAKCKNPRKHNEKFCKIHTKLFDSKQQILLSTVPMCKDVCDIILSYHM
jgi:hypothetical protein